MGICLDKIPHSCGTRTGLQVFEREDGGVDGYCFACAKPVRHPYGEEKKASELPKPKVKTPEEIQEELKEISELPVMDLVSRKLRKTHLDYFGVKVSLSEADGVTPNVVHYPYYKKGGVVGYKNRLISKKVMWSIGDVTDVELFGWEQAKKIGSNKIIITEGENDAVAVRSILENHTEQKYKPLIPAVVSLPHGAATAGPDLDRMKEEFKKYNFSQIVFCFDDDEAGKAAVQKGMLIFPNATSVTLPAKDANECILKGLAKEAHKSLTWGATKPKNTRLVFGEDIHQMAREQAKYGELTWPWETLNNATRGIRYGETIYIGGGVKMGKSDVLNSIAAHFIKKHRIQVFMAKPEEAIKKTYKLLAGKITGNVFHDPKVEFNGPAYDKAGKILDSKLAMIDMYQSLGWENLKDDIVSAVNWGTKAVFIDPITNLTNGMSSGDANVKIQEIAQDLAKMALDHNIVVFIFCHLKAPEGTISKDKRDSYYRAGKYIGLGNCPHEQGGDISSSQFAGSRAMMRSCNMMVGLEGNKDEELPQEIRNIRNLKLLEDREFGETITTPIYWNPNTTEYTEV